MRSLKCGSARLQSQLKAMSRNFICFCPSLSPSPSSHSPSPFVCLGDVNSDKTLRLAGPNLQLQRGTCGSFMCLTCYCFCNVWHEFIKGVSVCLDLLVRFSWSLSSSFALRKSSCTQRMKRQMSQWQEGRRIRRDNSHVAKVPAEIMFCDWKKRVVADSQGYPVDVGPRLGTETGVEILRHAVGTGDPGRVTKDSFRPEKLGIWALLYITTS